jgi:hypothetical protein
MDEELHPARIDRQRTKVTYPARLGLLPDGSFVRIHGANWLVLEDALLRWSPARYVERRRRVRDSIVAVLTPQPIVRCLAAGYKPEIHSSAVIESPALP